MYFNSPAEKIFDVTLGKEAVVKHLDIYEKVGKATSYTEYIEFELRNNKIYVHGKFADSAYEDDTGILHIIFKKGERDNPKINAIAIVKGTLADTDFEMFKTQLEEFERLKLEKERKQREFQKVSKSADFEDFEDDFVDTGSRFESGSAFFNFSTIGLLLVGLVIAYLFLTKPSLDNLNVDIE